MKRSDIVIRPLPDNFENIILKQHNSLTEARYEMSALERNIMYILLSKLNNKDTSDTVYSVSIPELEKATKKEIRSDELKEATHKLISRVYHIKNNNGLLVQTSLIAGANYKDGRGTIEITIGAFSRPYLFDLKNRFTTFNFSSVISLKSKYSKRLYEMLCQYKDTKIFKISVDELKYRLAIKDPKTGKDKKPIWAGFKTQILDTAEQQINESTDIKFNYTAKKVGRKFTDLEFNINNYKTKGLDNNKIIDIQQITIKELKEKMSSKYKLSNWQIMEIINKVEISEINTTLYFINLELLNKKVSNIGGYTATVFSQKYNIKTLNQKN